MRIVEHIEEMRSWSEAERCTGKRVVLVPTMGFLHEGHLSLVREGRKRGDRLVVSIFVNPAQFAPHEDFAAYPRDFGRDCKLLEEEGVDMLFHPAAQEMYPKGFQTYVDVEKLAPLLCGGFRLGHFRGVATVVMKLFEITQPDRAYFGEKDAQQLAVIRHLVSDLNVPVEIVGVQPLPNGIVCGFRTDFHSATLEWQLAFGMGLMQAAFFRYVGPGIGGSASVPGAPQPQPRPSGGGSSGTPPPAGAPVPSGADEACKLYPNLC